MGRGRRSGPRGRRASLTTALGVVVLALLLLAADRFGLIELDGPGGEPPSAPAVSRQAAARPEEMGDGLEVYFLDVGQGDSALLRFCRDGRAFHMLIDTGEYAYADGLTDYLKDLGVESLDALVISHPHTDHMGCAARIIQRFEPGGVYMPWVPEELAPTTSAYEALLDAVIDKGMTITDLRQAADGETVEIVGWPEELELTVLAPRPDADWEDLNDHSAVFRVAYGKTSFLFTGDAEKQSEKLILEDAAAYGCDLKADVLKCGHHGSKTSTSADFLKAAAPAWAVVSCGKDNDYGHPHKGTLEKLEKLGVELYRTDRDGTILAKSDGKTVAWETGLPSVPARQWK